MFLINKGIWVLIYVINLKIPYLIIAIIITLHLLVEVIVVVQPTKIRSSYPSSFVT